MKTGAALAEARGGAEAAPPPGDAAESARTAGLRYVSDEARGIARRRAGNGFVYTTADGKLIRDAAEIRRIKSLAIPPAWSDVWICPLPNGHLQATGRDAKGRKQHRYHPRWREVRDQTKYEKLPAFAKQLPAIRRQVKKDLALAGLPRRKVLATVVRLLESGMIRVGNEEYARQNGSFGLATLRTRHVNVSGPRIRFEFRGKSGVRHAFDLSDRRLAKIIRRCQELPGHELFQYIDEEGERCDIGSADVNDYLRAVAGDDFSSKDFRTWAGTVLAAKTLLELDRTGAKKTRRNITRALEGVAKQLGNTIAVCRKCYVHPAVFAAYHSGALGEIFKAGENQRAASKRCGLTPDEFAVAALLRRNLRQARESLRERLRASLRKRSQARGPRTRAAGAPALRSAS